MVGKDFTKIKIFHIHSAEFALFYPSNINIQSGFTLPMFLELL